MTTSYAAVVLFLQIHTLLYHTVVILLYRDIKVAIYRYIQIVYRCTTIAHTYVHTV